MSFQDKYKEYKERQEAKKYFRSNNDQFLDQSQLLKTIGGGIICAIACGVVLGIVISALHITSSLFYLICGYAIARAVTTLSGIHSKQVAIISVLCTFLCFVIGEMTMIYIPFYQMGIGFDLINFFDLFMLGIKTLFIGDLFGTIIAVLGLFISYQQAQ